jgi:HEAT repeat protein
MESASQVSVFVRSLSGHEVEIVIASDVKVNDLKVEVSKVWPTMPAAFQTLVTDDSTLEDHTGLSTLDLSGDNSSLSVTTFLSTESIARAISSLNSTTTKEAQLESLASLAMLGSKYHDEIISPVGKLLDVVDAEVSLAALNCITKIAQKGNMAAIDLVTMQLGHESSREAAASALEEIADTGDSYAMAGLARFRDNEDVYEDTDLCLFALEILGKFAGKGHHGAILAVSKCLCHDDDTIRWKAVELLQHLVATGDQRGISYAKALLRHPNRGVRWAAEEALGQLGDP